MVWQRRSSRSQRRRVQFYWSHASYTIVHVPVQGPVLADSPI